MPILNVNVENKIATGDAQTVVCDNTDYVVKFVFDDEWDEYRAKTMRVVYSNGTYDDVIFNGDECPLPRVYNSNRVKIGVYAGNIHTTVAAIFECKKSVLSGATQHVPPSEDVYNQIMDAINSGMVKGDKGDTGDYIDVTMELNPATGILTATYTRKPYNE